MKRNNKRTHTPEEQKTIEPTSTSTEPVPVEEIKIMGTKLTKRIDFMGIILVNNANPNGDPLNGNRPRITYNGYGEISDVALKRKIRDSAAVLFNQPILVRADENNTSIASKIQTAANSGEDKKPVSRAWMCEHWFDVRAFGQVFAFSKNDKNLIEGTTTHVRGPVSISSAFSVTPMAHRVTALQITKSINNETEKQKGSDTMGMKYRIDHGLYVFTGGISPFLAEKTGFSCEDAEILKKAMLHMFEIDASAARPMGSMVLTNVFWVEHDSNVGVVSPYEVHRWLKISVKNPDKDPMTLDDYMITFAAPEALTAEKRIIWKDLVHEQTTGASKQ